MTYDPALPVSFRSLVKDGKFYTLDGEKEVSSPYYAKWITSINDLKPVEIHYILIRYSQVNKQLQDLGSMVEKIKL